MNHSRNMIAMMLGFALVSGPLNAHGAAICGDINGDGVVTPTDGVLVGNYANNPNFDGLAATRCRNAGILQCADVNQSGAVTVTDQTLVLRAAANLSSPCTVDGFASSTNRVSGSPAQPYVTVTSVLDTGLGTLRAALAGVGAGGALIVFALPPNSTITPMGSGFIVPANTTIDGIGSGVTINGSNITSNGTVRVQASNVAIRHIRVRNAGDDGIQVVPKTGTSAGIQNIAIQHTTVVRSNDGGIDTTGCIGISASGCAGGTLSNVTLADNYLSANGSSAGGGANLSGYGATNLTYVGNLWDKNLRRDPDLDNTNTPTMISLGDIRYNVIKSPKEHWIKVVGTNARANVVVNYFRGTSLKTPVVWMPTPQGLIYAPAGNVIPAGFTLTDGPTTGTPFTAPAVSERTESYVLSMAGALPHSTFENCFRNAATYDAARLCP